MHHPRIPPIASALVALGFSLLSIAPAQAGSGFTIEWFTIDGGGGTSSGGAFTLSGTIGQADAGAVDGGAFELHGGFWVPAGPALPRCFGDLDLNGVVDGADLGAVLSAWGTGSGPADLNGDGIVDGADLGDLLSVWGACTG